MWGVARQTVEAGGLEGEDPFNVLMRALVQPGYRLACAMLHDAQLAEDVVQDASLIAWRKMKQLEDRTRAKAWFLGIVANECRNARRNRWWGRVTLGLPATLSVAPGEEKWVNDADVRDALRRLSHADRLVVSLYFYLDLPLDEVANVLATNVEAARKRLYRAVRRLRPDLEVEEDLR